MRSKTFAVANTFYKLSGVFLTVLCLLHLFWFILFFKIAYNITQGNVEDIQNKVTKRNGDGQDAAAPLLADNDKNIENWDYTNI